MRRKINDSELGIIWVEVHPGRSVITVTGLKDPATNSDFEIHVTGEGDGTSEKLKINVCNPADYLNVIEIATEISRRRKEQVFYTVNGVKGGYVASHT